MTLLIADVGGTNTRVALAEDGVPTALRYFSNDDFADLLNVLQSYLGDHADTRIDACCIAMAGPVQGRSGRLTNRDWQVDADRIGVMLGGAETRLLNDLTALGFALEQLAPEACASIRTAALAPQTNRQSLVVGIGTGFNLCPVIASDDGAPQCLVVEAGHTSLPRSVADAFAHADAFATTEDLFSGAGLAALHALEHHGARMGGADIVGAHRSGTDARASHTVTLMVDLLGRLSAELALLYMPLDGIYFAGSVARGLLSPDQFPTLLRHHAFKGKLGDQPERIPMSLILDDAAALRGCIAAATGRT